MLYLLSHDQQDRTVQFEMSIQVIRKHAALVALCAGNQVSKIATIRKTDKSFSYKINWGKAGPGGYVRSVVKQKKHPRRFDAVGNDDFNANPEHRRYRRQKSIRAIPSNRVDYVASERLNVIQKDPAPAH